MLTDAQRQEAAEMLNTTHRTHKQVPSLKKMIADLASCVAVVLGGNPMLLTDIDIRNIPGSVLKNGELVTKGSSKAVMGNPVNAIA